MHKKLQFSNPKDKNNVWDQGIAGRIINIKTVLKKYDVMLQTGLNWLRKWTIVAGSDGDSN
jgi:hypothetical protein